MGFIEGLSNDISKKLGNRLDKTEEDISILNYGLFIIIHTSLAIILTILVGIITNTMNEIIVITFSAAWMKRYSGGVHASTPNRCLIVGIIVSLVLASCNKLILPYIGNSELILTIIILMFLSYIILHYKCPVGTKNKPLKKEETRKRLRKKAFKLANFYFLIIFISYIFYLNTNIDKIKSLIISILLGLTLQTLMLTAIGKNLILNIEKLLEKMKIW